MLFYKINLSLPLWVVAQLIAPLCLVRDERNQLRNYYCVKLHPKRRFPPPA